MSTRKMGLLVLIFFAVAAVTVSIYLLIVVVVGFARFFLPLTWSDTPTYHQPKMCNATMTIRHTHIHRYVLSYFWSCLVRNSVRFLYYKYTQAVCIGMHKRWFDPYISVYSCECGLCYPVVTIESHTLYYVHCAVQQCIHILFSLVVLLSSLSNK